MCYILLDAIINVAIVAWFIVGALALSLPSTISFHDAGCIFVYGARNVTFSPPGAFNYCNETVYGLAFAMVTVQASKCSLCSCQKRTQICIGAAAFILAVTLILCVIACATQEQRVYSQTTPA